MKVCALIAAFNEANAIGKVVEGVRPRVNHVLVVDDGSSDETAERAVRAGAECVRLARNSGKGAALREALRHIGSRDFTHVLFMDGDGQHDPTDVPALLAAVANSNTDLVIGTRSFSSAGMPRSRYCSNTLGSRATSRLVGRTILDSQSGFRVVRLDCLRAIRLRANRYEFEMEVLVKLCGRGATVVHVPVRTIYDTGGARSKMHPVRDTLRICLWSLAFRYFGD